MSQEEFEARKRGQDQFHWMLREARICHIKKDVVQAEKWYLKALTFSEGSSSESVSRGEMSEFYENIGEYEKALKQVNWFLVRLNPNEPLWFEMNNRKNRLIQKIEVQKRGEKIEEPKPGKSTTLQTQPIRRVTDFHGADYASQKQFLEKELPEDTEINRLSKQALLAEHAGRFEEAKQAYEKMLPQKEQVIAAVDEVGWVMLHPAIQRMSELTGDEIREKEMLIWIRDNMLIDQGIYHRYFRSLPSDVQDHLKKRIEKYQL